MPSRLLMALVCPLQVCRPTVSSMAFIQASAAVSELLWCCQPEALALRLMYSCCDACCMLVFWQRVKHFSNTVLQQAAFWLQDQSDSVSGVQSYFGTCVLLRVVKILST